MMYYPHTQSLADTDFLHSPAITDYWTTVYAVNEYSQQAIVNRCRDKSQLLNTISVSFIKRHLSTGLHHLSLTADFLLA